MANYYSSTGYSHPDGFYSSQPPSSSSSQFYSSRPSLDPQDLNAGVQGSITPGALGGISTPGLEATGGASSSQSGPIMVRNWYNAFTPWTGIEGQEPPLLQGNEYSSSYSLHSFLGLTYDPSPPPFLIRVGHQFRSHPSEIFDRVEPVEKGRSTHYGRCRFGRSFGLLFRIRFFPSPRTFLKPSLSLSFSLSTHVFKAKQKVKAYVCVYRVENLNSVISTESP